MASTKGNRFASAFQSVSSQLTTVLQTGKLNTSNDAKIFASSRRGEVTELKAALTSPQREKKKVAVKKVIAAMTLGKDVSSLFPEVVNCMQTTNLELKKLVYLYVINFARNRPELAVLAINTFRKDTLDPNPLVRALAIRTMGCIRLSQIVEYLIEPLNRLCRDTDPYVRKSAAICVGKLYDTSPIAAEENGFLETLKDMMQDSTPMVVVNVVATLDEISQVSKKNLLSFHPETVSKLILALPDCSEWGQIIVLDVIAGHYQPETKRESITLIERLTSRLSHANPGVILSCTRLLLKLMDGLSPETNPEEAKLIDHTVQRKLTPPLLSLMSSDSPELQFVVLRNLQIIVHKYPEMLRSESRVFFIKFNDPPFVKFEKLELLVTCATICGTGPGTEMIIKELCEYSHEVDVDFVKRAIRSLGRICLLIEGVLDLGMRTLASLLETKTTFVVEEVIVVLRDIFRKYPNQYESILPSLMPLAPTVEDPESRSAIVWMIGEYAERLPSAPQMIQFYISKFLEEPYTVQLQILAAAVKIYLKYPKGGTEEMVFDVLKRATEEIHHPDLRDRAFIYWRMLTTDPRIAQRVVCTARPPINMAQFSFDPKLHALLISQIGLLSSVYHEYPSTFVVALRDKESARTLPEDDTTTEDEAEKISTVRHAKESIQTNTLIDFSDVSEEGSN